MSFSLWDVVKDRCPKVKVVDVGAMDLGQKNCPCYKLSQIDACEIIGFEPDEKECEKLNQSNKGEYLSYVIGRGDKRTFRTCNHNMTSSFYEPNTALVEKFQNLEELMKVVDRQEVTTRRLDDIDEVKGADFLKMDAEGAEFDILTGAAELLKDVVAIHTEVIMLPLRLDSPLFAQTDALLQGSDFLFHTFYGISGRAFKPLVVRNDLSVPLKQMLWGDAVYARNFMNYGSLAPDKLLKLAVILHEAYGSYDLAHYALAEYDKQTGTDLSGQYRREVI